MAHGIPPGWEVMTSRSKGLDYYFNKKSGKQYWVHKDLPQGWSKIIEADRRTYYFHISDEMGTRSYEKPAAVASAPLSPPPQPHHIHAPSVNESTNPHFSHPPQRRGSNSLHDLLSPVAASVASPEEQYHHTAPQRDKRPREDVESPRSESKHIRRDVASCDRRSSPPRNTREMEPAWATSRPTPAESSTSRSLVTDGTDQEQAAQFYSKLSRKKTSDRADSRLYHMRCMNNWVKSVLIQEYSQKQSRVLDLACGKGGDMNKWARHNFQMYMGVDIALGSLEDAATRIQQNADLSRSDIHLVHGDLGEISLLQDALPCWTNQHQWHRAVPLDHPHSFDVVSMQFAFHYMFCDEARATQFFVTLHSTLRPGGMFIATTIDPNRVIQKLMATVGGEEIVDGKVVGPAPIQLRDGKDRALCTIRMDPSTTTRLLRPTKDDRGFGLR
ncbi:hypothetical protein, variant 1 [Aphanomyces invadans]|nr:hypothetical protein, variant 1 [Aphanomyces invadans]ETV98356.1 hypothetical protein, variant 1 [Aphanomyces invadans]|eukprot:XP_008873231.1 hypothetical protein, variant 1 [Aphanomyces invadans]